MERLKYPMNHEWHVAISRHHDGKMGTSDWKRWMYEAKSMADEVPRMALMLGKERRGELSQTHKQCLMTPAVPIQSNHLTCCLGVKCAECPELLALDKMERVTPEEINTAKAWTCAAHIVSEGGDTMKEGYLLDVSDRMYWDNVCESLSQSDEGANVSGEVEHFEPTECCGYLGKNYPVIWNQWNKVIQCHNCGQVYHSAAPAQRRDKEVGISKAGNEPIAPHWNNAGGYAHMPPSPSLPSAPDPHVDYMDKAAEYAYANGVLEKRVAEQRRTIAPPIGVSLEFFESLKQANLELQRTIDELERKLAMAREALWRIGEPSSGVNFGDGYLGLCRNYEEGARQALAALDKEN